MFLETSLNICCYFGDFFNNIKLNCFILSSGFSESIQKCVRQKHFYFLYFWFNQGQLVFVTSSSYRKKKTKQRNQNWKSLWNLLQELIFMELRLVSSWRRHSKLYSLMVVWRSTLWNIKRRKKLKLKHCRSQINLTQKVVLFKIVDSKTATL